MIGVDAIAVGVDHLRKLRMRDRAVVAFVEIFDDDLPVRREVVSVPPNHPHLREFDPRALENRRQFANQIAKWSGVRSGVDENQRPPRFYRKRCERERFPGERALLILARRRAERAVEVVGPAVIVALQRLAIAGAFEHDLAPAMTAYVGERADRAARITNDHDRQIAQIRREEIADATDLRGMSDVLPRAMKDSFLLSLKDGVIDVPSRGQRIAALERGRERGIGEDICGPGHLSLTPSPGASPHSARLFLDRQTHFLD